MNAANNNDLIPMGAPSMDFPIVMRGYERNQVNEAIRSLEDDLRTIMAERDQALTQAAEEHARAENLGAEIGELKTQLRNSEAPTFETMGGRIASMLRLAEEEAAEIRRAAEEDAQQTRERSAQEKEDSDRQIASDRAEADQYVADRRGEADEVLATAKAEAAEYIEQHRKQAEEHLAGARAEADELTAQSAARRAEAEEDFKITLDARRTAAAQEEAERDRTSREDAANRIQASRDEADALLTKAHAEASAVVEEANTRSRTMVERAEDEVNRLEHVRAALAQQIAQVGQIVSQVPAFLAKAPEELARDRDVDAPRAAEPRRPDLFAEGREVTTDEAAAVRDDDAALPDDVQPEAVAASEPSEPEQTAEPIADAGASQDEPAEPAEAAELAEVGEQPTEDAAPGADVPDGELQQEVDAHSGPPTSARSPRVRLARRTGGRSDDESPSERTVEVSAIRQRRPRR